MSLSSSISAFEQLGSHAGIAQAVQVRTAAWYGDTQVDLEIPEEWELNILLPEPLPALTNKAIEEILNNPIGQPPIKQALQGKTRPLIVVDDLVRPTPVARVIPFLLKQFQEAGIPARNVRILMATGTHPASPQESVLRKVGPEAAAACQVLVHQSNGNVTKVGRTSSGTPVYVNNEVVQSDFVVGIGGVYPNYTAGFGGGSKIALGVLGFQSIQHMHYAHPSLGWGQVADGSSFRKDLDEIARIIGLNTIISMHVNADREPVGMACGNHLTYFKDALALARRIYAAPRPVDADVVIANAYPSDLSLTIAHMKGMTPLYHCPPNATRIAIAACSEGFGHHGLFPLMNPSPLHRVRKKVRRLWTMRADTIRKEIWRLTQRRLSSTSAHKESLNGVNGSRRKLPLNPIWLYRPGTGAQSLPTAIADVRLAHSWPDVLQTVRAEQPANKRLKVYLYACAPLQCFD